MTVGIRPTWDETWMTLAFAIAERSRCSRRKAGCVIVSDSNRIVSVGYNGPPSGWTPKDAGKYIPLSRGDNCEGWCDRAVTGGCSNKYDDCPSIHSEVNAIINGDMSSAVRGTAYVTSCPCLSCAKALSNIGVTCIVLNVSVEDLERDPDMSIEFMRSSGIKVIVVDSVGGT